MDKVVIGVDEEALKYRVWYEATEAPNKSEIAEGSHREFFKAKDALDYAASLLRESPVAVNEDMATSGTCELCGSTVDVGITNGKLYCRACLEESYS